MCIRDRIACKCLINWINIKEKYMKSAITKNLRELRFILCHKSNGSKGLRTFIYNNYPKLKDANPLFPFMVRECEGVQANILARYSYGVERRVVVENCTEEEVNKVVEKLVDLASKSEEPLKKDPSETI
eukprot:TRINITY_DN8665_c0_g1_i2.p2 TRINITY_DN8665_c0_g1~~TRINITY_DN8665_c0_g1_i2.p2  ORF type:complete len:144 (-),score=28.56 TRINITY_DN8665_c0_g1_i2:167-553(-)